jgi:hypothetical protein
MDSHRSQRNKRGGKRATADAARRRSGKRLCLESLEGRDMMSASPLAVSPQWFQTVDSHESAIAACSHQTATSSGTSQWLLKLSDSARASMTSVSQAAHRLAVYGIAVEEGLGMNGWLLACAPVNANDTAACSRFFQKITDIASYSPNVEFRSTGVAERVNDPQAGQLYGLDKVDVAGAWNTTTGSLNQVVAVIDTGIDWSHPDLAANIWKNPREIAGNNIDDDGDGFVDDTIGWNFVANNTNAQDDNGHGTHVAGTIGAVGNNGLGVVGVNQHVSIMPVKSLGANGIGTTADAVRAINYVTAMKQHGVNVTVINASWAGGNSLALQDAVAATMQADILFVAAAGNQATNADTSPSYPAGYNFANVVSVAATDRLDQLEVHSNFGVNSVDLAAPGTGILSTYRGGTYVALTGTSMAAPHVAGVAALVGAASPTRLSAQQIRDIIFANVDPVSGLQGVLATGGRLNANRAVLAAAGKPLAPSNLKVANAWQTKVDLNWRDNSTNETGFRVEMRTPTTSWKNAGAAAANATSFRVTGLLPGTKYYFRVYAQGSGNKSAFSNEVSVTTPKTTSSLRQAQAMTALGTAASAVLQKDSWLFINVAHNDRAWFKAGTAVSYRADGSVSSGTLLNNTWLYTNVAHNGRNWFKAGTTVSLQTDGSVSSGTLLNNTWLHTNAAHNDGTWFKAGTSVSIQTDGSVISGTLLSNTWLYTNVVHNDRNWFKAGTAVTYRPDGSVSCGILLNDSSLYTNVAHSDRIWFKAGTAITYRSDGSVISGTLLSNSWLYVDAAHRQRVWFAAGTTIAFRTDGSVA